LIGEDAPDRDGVLKKTLTALGHTVLATTNCGDKLIEACRSALPDLVVVDIAGAEPECLEAAQSICGFHPVPVIVVSGYPQDELLERAGLCPNVMAYLPKPATEASLRPAIALGLRRFKQLMALVEETETLKRTLTERKVIERAKGVVMKRLQLDEGDAHRRMQKLAVQRNIKLMQLAEEIIAVEETLRGLDESKRP
jgi:response regulator NasT